MDVSDAKRLRALEDKNRKLKKLLTELMLRTAFRDTFRSLKISLIVLAFDEMLAVPVSTSLTDG